MFVGLMFSCKQAEKMKYPFANDIAWWQDARYGMFIHWGLSSLTGQEISWSRAGYGAEKYDSLKYRFCPSEFCADRWIDIAEQAGMRYMVLTAKHHDGFCLWDSKANSHNIMNTPYGKDICAQLAEAAHRRNMRLGWYFSCREWSDSDCMFEGDMHCYVEKAKEELRELLSNYGKIDVLWFDYDGWPSSAHPAELFDLARNLQPDIVINNRSYPITPDESHAYVGRYGMYATPEQFVGSYGRVPWETCSTMTSSRQWSIRYGDSPRSAEDLIWETVGAVAGNGNMLMNVGPDSLGVIPQAFADRLAEVGGWIQAHPDILYGTQGGPWKPSKQYVSTMKGQCAHLIIREGKDLTLPYSSRIKLEKALTDDGKEVSFEIEGDSITFSVPNDYEGKRNVVLTLQCATKLDKMEPLAAFSTSGSLAYDKPSSSSSSLSETYMHCPSSAFDDDNRTAWLPGRVENIDSMAVYGQNLHFQKAETQGKLFQQDAVLEVDLQSAEEVKSYSVQSRDGRKIRGIRLEYLDRKEWKEVAFMEDFSGKWEGEIAPVKAQHWRLNMKGIVPGAGIAEFQLFAPSSEL